MFGRRSVALSVALTSLVVVACSADDDGRGIAGPPRDAGVVPSDAWSGASGLPCDVATVLSAHCTVCHAATPLGGAPMALVTRADLMAPSITMPSMSNAVLSVARMQDTTAPMPPGTMPTVTAAEIATLQSWIDAGMPAGDCADPTNPYDTPVQCSSGTTWNFGDHGSELMHPGLACMQCHDSLPFGEGPDFPLTIGGTVYPTAHEPDDCYGSMGNGDSVATVVVTGADGMFQVLYPNEAGNFMSYTRIALPITAAVRYQGRTRAMVTPSPTADCNTCHTRDGTSDAPGRIMLP